MANVVGSGKARTLVDTDGDPVGITGTALDVQIKNASGVNGFSGLEVVQDTAAHLLATVTQASATGVHVDDGDFTLNSSSGIAMMGFQGSQSITAGDVGVLTCSSDGYLKVQLQPSGSTIVTEIEEDVNITGTVTVTSLDTSPATFDTVTSLKIDTADDTSWHRLHSNTASKEVQVQSLSTNVDIIYLGKYVDESSEVESIELVPAASISLPLSNLNLLSYKKPAHTTINQYLLVTVLTNA